MKLPKKINPERIRDAVVQLDFSSDIPFEPLIGYLYDVLSKIGFSYSNRPIEPRHFIRGDAQLVTLDVIPRHFFFDDFIKLEVKPDGALVFAPMSQYPGWGNYFEQIKQIFEPLMRAKRFNFVHRVGLRYISEFPNVDILENVNCRVELSGLDAPMNSGNFRVDWEKNGLRHIVNLASKLPIKPLVVETPEPIHFTSLIDIDVFYAQMELQDIDSILDRIIQIHDKEKDLFFQLLKPEFLKTLNPEY